VSGLGTTDLFTLHDPRRSGLRLPDAVSVERLKTARYPGMSHPLRWRAAWLARRGIPLEVANRRLDPNPRREFESWVSPSYELVWFNTAALFEWMGRPRLGPTVVDLDNLQDEIARSRARLLRTELSGAHPARAVRQALAIGQSSLNAWDWRRFQRSVAADVDRVVLASELDRQRSGLAGSAAVIPNAFDRPQHPVGHEGVGAPPVLLFQGRLNYAPNVDAARWLAEEIAPRVRVWFPDAEVRLVGRPDPHVKLLHDPPAVTVIGRVPAMEPELARADIVVVPIRFGSGTRLKILEAFAHRVPVVSTTLGAEGLEVQTGTHLLLGDDAESFAAACRRVLSDGALRARLVAAAERLYLERYESSVVRDRIRALVRDEASSSTRS
jgi:glycosyltransferase involved in cell wall biosynthesis